MWTRPGAQRYPAGLRPAHLDFTTFSLSQYYFQSALPQTDSQIVLTAIPWDQMLRSWSPLSSQGTERTLWLKTPGRGHMMDTQLHTKLDEVVEELRQELYQKAEHWSKIRTPSELFDFEQELQATLNTLQAGIVGTVLEAIHRDDDFVIDCQSQVRQQRRLHSDGWHDVWVHTFGGQYVQLKTPYAKLPKCSGQARKRKKQRQQGSGLYPVLRRLGIVRRTTPRLLAEANRQLADGPSGAEAAERFASREIRLAQIPLRLLVRDFASIALWQRQANAVNLADVEVIEPAPLAGKRVVVGLDRGRLHLRIDKKSLTRDGQDSIPQTNANRSSSRFIPLMRKGIRSVKAMCFMTARCNHLLNCSCSSNCD